MTKAEAAQMVAVIVAAYPNFDKFRSPDEVKNYVGLLAMMFEQDSGGAVGLAVKKHIATSKWPPSVAEIRELMLETTHPEIVPPDLAWAAVSDLMFTFGRYQWDDVKKRLPALVVRCVEIVGWRQLYDLHQQDANAPGRNAGLDRVAFMKQYEPMYERAKREAMTPAPISMKISGKQAALPDTSYRLIESAEAGRRMKELEIAEQKAENQRRIAEAIKQDELERKARLAEWRARKERGEIDPRSPVYAAIEALAAEEGGQHAKG